ncbi:MAG: tRNA (adenosine(37)-N6)-threonylcarbamoyltransferase complex ATPase subunit type 1 TsaE [Kiritimatiellae bacterium]|nr:tRNA (adenosine(37)-N6)-threonylcarbamoyltransferase complex ATPase subunit type 1 TsaE [Kiritimatiellia bacterium]
MKTRTVVSNSPEETQALAADLAAKLKPGAVLALHGELGSGKTCFVQGLARGLGVRHAVTSPTYTIVNEYSGRCPLVHMDLYRLQNPQELLGIDFENYLETEGVIVIEWAERSGNWLPGNTMHIYFETGAALNERTITMAAGARV